VSFRKTEGSCARYRCRSGALVHGHPLTSVRPAPPGPGRASPAHDHVEEVVLPAPFRAQQAPRPHVPTGAHARTTFLRDRSSPFFALGLLVNGRVRSRPHLPLRRGVLCCCLPPCPGRTGPFRFDDAPLVAMNSVMRSPPTVLVSMTRDRRQHDPLIAADRSLFARAIRPPAIPPLAQRSISRPPWRRRRSRRPAYRVQRHGLLLQDQSPLNVTCRPACPPPSFGCHHDGSRLPLVQGTGRRRGHQATPQASASRPLFRSTALTFCSPPRSRVHIGVMPVPSI